MSDLLAEHKGELTDEVARVALLQAETYASHLGQKEQANTLLHLK